MNPFVMAAADRGLRAHLMRTLESADAAMNQQLAARGLTTAPQASPVGGVADRPRGAAATALQATDLGGRLGPFPFPPSSLASLPPPVALAPPPMLPHQHSPLVCNTCAKSPSKTSSVTSTVHSMLARCSGCRAVYYCSKVCQRDDWNRHKFLCRHVRNMDVHQLSFIKISSTIPGNYHRPAELLEQGPATTIAAETPQQSAEPLETATAESGAPGRVRSKRRRPRMDASGASGSFAVASSAGAAASSGAFEFVASPVAAPPNADPLTLLLGPDSCSSDSESGSTPPSDSECDEHHEEVADKRKRRRTAPTAAVEPTSAAMSEQHASSNPNATLEPPFGTVRLSIQPLVLSSDGTRIRSTRLTDAFAAYGHRPTRGQTCLLFFQCRHSNGSVFAKNRGVFFNSGPAGAPAAANLSPAALNWISELDAATPMRFALGAGEVIECWDAAVETMFRGECATVITRDDNTRQVFVFEMQLVDFW